MAAPNAIKTFYCKLCDKGYSRQPDFEAHYSSYDHNHRQNSLAGKEVIAANDRTSKRPHQKSEMRKLPVEGATKMAGAGFRKAIVETGPGTAGPGFRKVGVPVVVDGAPSRPKVETKDVTRDLVTKDKDISEQPMKLETKDKDSGEQRMGLETKDKGKGSSEQRQDPSLDEDAVMGEDQEENITWEEYDFRKPTGCDHATCPGCKTTGVMNEDWVLVGAD